MSDSSNRWLQRQKKDPFVSKAKQSGYRSRAVFKLQAMQKKDRLITPGMTVLDLGAAPGGWSQMATEWVGQKGQVIGVDLLDIDSMAHVTFIKGDFTDEAVQKELLETIQGQAIQVILSDMAPNMSGHRTVDQLKSIQLIETALAFVVEHLAKGGHFVVKAFEGEGLSAFRQALKQHFKTVLTRKPEASRSESREVYLVAKQKRT